MKNILNKKINFLILSFFLFLFPVLTAKADGTATTGISGNSSVYVGKTIDVVLYVNSVSGANGGLAAFGGNISYSTDKLELVKTTSLAPFTVELAGNKLGGFGANTIKGRQNVMRFTFKAKATGNATISYSGIKQPDADAKYVNISSSSKTISITNPPSTNNNLSSLSVSNGSINFNKNTTSYNISVDTNVTSIKISATAEDKGASVSGTGTKNLGYGNNKFSIIVTAPSGDKKTYTITVNRKDNRSSNNKLSSLSVDGAELSPKFNSNTKSYTVSVPFSISSLKINAKADDSKSKVSISNTSINAEETKDINITVTAENGSTNTYVIRATRGKDPNKVLSKNNNLSSLKVSQGILSPAFKKEQDKYIVYLPYEVDSIKIDATVEDTKYATIKIEGAEKLSTGNNNYKIIVTAEDGSTKTYTVVVSRGLNMTEESLSSNVYLKSITLKKGSLKENFISIGMIDNSDKINYSRIRIPKNELGKKIIEKFIRSYLHEGIKEQKTVKNYGENLNTVCYIETNDEKFFEVYTIKNDLKIDGFNIDLEYLPQTNIKDTRKIELASISDKIKHLNDMLNEDDEIINKKTL